MMSGHSAPCEIRQLFSLEMEPVFHEKRDLQFKNPYQIVKSGKYETFCVSKVIICSPRGGRGVINKVYMSPNKIFMFLINPPSGNVKVQKMILNIYSNVLKKKGEDGKATLGVN